MSKFVVKGCDDCPFMGNDIDLCNAVANDDTLVDPWIDPDAPPPDRCPLRRGKIVVSLAPGIGTGN